MASPAWPQRRTRPAAQAAGRPGGAGEKCAGEDGAGFIELLLGFAAERLRAAFVTTALNQRRVKFVPPFVVGGGEFRSDVRFVALGGDWRWVGTDKVARTAGHPASPINGS